MKVIQVTSIIGRSGIEATYEKELRGEVGGKIVIVDENNNVIKTVAQKEAKDGTRYYV